MGGDLVCRICMGWNYQQWNTKTRLVTHFSEVAVSLLTSFSIYMLVWKRDP